jgi:hypothetical protein
VALLITSDRSEKVDLPKDGPIGIAEVELAVGTLPEHEAREAHLAAGPDDQIRIGAVVGVEVLGQRVGGNTVEEVFRAVTPHEVSRR